MIIVKQTIQRDPTISHKVWKEISKNAWLAAGEFWHRFILRKKFTDQAKAEYNYQPRQQDRFVTDKSGHRLKARGYESKKAIRFGHRRPLEYTGELKRMVMRIRDVSSIGDGKAAGGTKIALHGPQYLYQYRKNLSQPDKARELAAISEADASTLTDKLDKDIDKALNHIEWVKSLPS